MNSDIVDIQHIHVSHAIAKRDEEVLDLFFKLINDFIKSEVPSLEKTPAIYIEKGKVVFVTRINQYLTPKRTFPFSIANSNKENSRSLQLAVRNTMKSFNCNFQEEKDCISLKYQETEYKIQF